MQVVLTSPAMADLAELITFYDERATHLADGLVSEIEDSVRRIAEHPDAGAPHHNRTRRFLLQQFPLAVIYRIQGETAEVVAIAHQRQHPGYWTAREPRSTYPRPAA